MSAQPATHTITIAEIAEIAEIADELPRLIDGVARHKTHIVVEQDGQPVAAIIACDDYLGIEKDQRDLDWEQTTHSLQRMSDAFADVPVEELEAQIDEIIGEGRRRRASAYRSA